MIKTSKHNISKISNNGKLASLNTLINDYKLCLSHYIELILNESLPLKTNLSSKLLPIYNLEHSKYRRIIYKQASEIIRSNYKKSNGKRYNNYKKIYSYMKNNHPDSLFVTKKYAELKLKDLIKSKYFIKPKINNITINLTNEFFNIELGKYFDCFINIKLPYFNEKGTRALQTNIPVKYHKHSNKLMNNGYNLKNTIQIKSFNGKIFINLIWFKEDSIKKINGDSLGIDLGYKKLITTSNGDIIGDDMFYLYDKISKKQQGSKNFKDLLIHRDNLINYYVNKLDLDKIKLLIIEDLKYVKHKTSKRNKKKYIHNKVMNKIQRWSYVKTIDKLDKICVEKGIVLVKVSPAYTSQMCSSCGNISNKSRNGEDYLCVSCGYENDADVNASINIRNRGIYSFSDEKSVFL